MAADRDEDFGAMLEESLAADTRRTSRRLRAGEKVDGKVVQITKDTVFVDVGTKSEGRIDRSQLQDKDGQLRVAVGDRVRATVASDGPEGPELVVSFGRGRLDTSTLELAAESGTPVEGTVSNAVKAGLEVDFGGVRAFCPASQIDVGYTADLEIYVGQTHFFKVLEVRDGGRSVVVSRRALVEQERAEQAHELAQRLEVGTELEGIVQTIQPYGVFVDVGGLQGLVHVSELAHGRVARPEDIVSVGEQVRVKVLSVEQPASGKARDLRISLSMKAMAQPKEGETVTADEVVTGTVSKVESFGVFVDTAAGRGLVPTRELGLTGGADPRKAFPVGKEVEVVVLSQDGSGKLRLSIKAVAEAEERRNYRDFQGGGKKKGELGSLGDLLQGVELGGEQKKRKPK